MPPPGLLLGSTRSPTNLTTPVTTVPIAIRAVAIAASANSSRCHPVFPFKNRSRRDLGEPGTPFTSGSIPKPGTIDSLRYLGLDGAAAKSRAAIQRHHLASV